MRTVTARTFWWLVFAVSLTLVAGGTLVPSGTHTAGWARCVFCNPRALADGLVNVALFLPLALSARLLGVGVVTAIAAGAALSVTIEVLQLFVPGRDPSYSDIIANTAGAVAGALMAGGARAGLRPPQHVSEWLALAAALVACATWGATAYLTAPSMPPTAYWGQWTPRLESLEPYLGQVQAATVGGVAVPPERVDDSAGLRQRLSDGAPIHVRLTTGPKTTRISSIFSIADEKFRRVLLVGAVQDDLVFRYRTRAVDWWLDQPDIRRPGAWSRVRSGEVVDLDVASQRRGYCVSVAGDQACGLGYGVGDGWSLVVSAASVPVPARRVLQTAWVALLTIPVGFWSRRGAKSFAAFAVVVAGLILIPGLSGLLHTRPHEWAGAALGLAGGAGVSTLWR